MAIVLESVRGLINSTILAHTHERHCLYWNAPLFETEVQSDSALPAQSCSWLVLHSRDRRAFRAQLDLPNDPQTRGTTQPDQLRFFKKPRGYMAKLCAAFREVFDRCHFR